MTEVLDFLVCFEAEFCFWRGAELVVCFLAEMVSGFGIDTDADEGNYRLAR
jgi:hypothetical protein